MAQTAIEALCDVCGTDQDVRLYCVNCEENICSNCNIYHSKSKRTRNDKVVLITDARHENITKTPVIVCEDHSSEEVTLFCSKCNKLICNDCLTKKHKGHYLTSLKEIRNTATNDLMNLLKHLQSKKKFYNEAMKTEGQFHNEYMTSLEQCKEDVQERLTKLIDELKSVCNDEISKLAALQSTETERYSDACTMIQNQTKTVISTLQMIQSEIDSGNPVNMLQAKEDATKVAQELQDPTRPKLFRLGFQQASIERQAIRQHMKIVHKNPKPQLLINTRRKSGVSRSFSNEKREIDINKVRIKRTIEVEGNHSNMNAIIATKNDCFWVLPENNKCLILINNRGNIIKESVTACSKIEDAKAYDARILFTCNGKCKVFMLSEDGANVSTFSDFEVYFTDGLCVTQEMDVLVCLHPVTNAPDPKIVRLGRVGNILQTFQFNKNGNRLYECPSAVTSTSTGEVFVVDLRIPRPVVICMSRDGHHLFTWTVEGMSPFGFHPERITYDAGNVFVSDCACNKVYAIKKDGSGAQCLLDAKQKVKEPRGLSVSEEGDLLVGCRDGKIKVIEY